MAAAGRAPLVTSEMSLASAPSHGATEDSEVAAPGCSGGGFPRQRGEKVGRGRLRGDPARMDRPVAAAVTLLVDAACVGCGGVHPASGCGVCRLRRWVLLGRRSIVLQTVFCGPREAG